MPLRIVIDVDSGLAPWRQVHDQIVRAATSGALAEGTLLPPIRQLARDLGLAAGTVARAYRELETAGWVSTARARGTVITVPATRPDPVTLLNSAVAELITRAKELGADVETTVAVVRAQWPVDPTTKQTTANRQISSAT